MNQSSSDDSSGEDNCEKVRNVRATLVKIKHEEDQLDDNFAHKRQLGDLIFDANFESANLGFVDQIDRHEYDLMVRPDVANPRHRSWFNFMVSNQHPNQLVVFTVVNLSEQSDLFYEGLSPVARSRLQPNWQRLARDQVFWYKSSNHNNRLVLSIAFRFIDSTDEHQFALFYPYSFSQLESLIGRWQLELKRRRQHLATKETERRSLKVDRTAPGAHLQIEVLTKSILFKPVYMLKLSKAQRKEVPAPSADSKPKVVIIRQTSGNFDGCASFVCQGFIDSMLNDLPVGCAARASFDAIVFPMVDPDSTVAGNSRTDLFGQPEVRSRLINTNRNLYENFHQLRRRLEQICLEAGAAPVLIVELRSNASLIGARLVGAGHTDQLRAEQHQHLARLLAKFADGFYLEQSSFSASNLPIISALDQFQCPAANMDQYRLEVSPFAYYKRSLAHRVFKEYTREKYLLLGKALLYSLVDLFRPKERASLDPRVGRLLDSFQTNASDIDDLVLRKRRPGPAAN